MFLACKTLHNLVLRQASSGLGAFHCVATALVRVADVAQAERSATILVACEFRCTLSVCCSGDWF